MSDEPKKRRRAWIGWASFALLALLVLYPLSLGPALWLTNDDFSQWQIIGPVYRPLYWLGNRFDCVGEAIGWYVTKWINIQESGWTPAPNAHLSGRLCLVHNSVNSRANRQLSSRMRPHYRPPLPVQWRHASPPWVAFRHSSSVDRVHVDRDQHRAGHPADDSRRRTVCVARLP
jgi:hypothetical protein